MRRSYLEDPSGAYPRVLVLMSMASECLSWDDDLVDVRGAVVLY